MEILLVEVRGINNLHIHNGLASLGGALKGRRSYRIIDLNHLDWSIDELRDYIIRINPKILGFSVQSLNSKAVAEIISGLKGKVSSLIIVGGPYIGIRGIEYLQDNPGIDYGLQFETEKSIFDFFDYLSGQKVVTEVPGLVYRTDSGCLANAYDFPPDLDQIESPDFDNFEGLDPKKYFQRHSYPLLTSRGCPQSCVYCSVKVFSGRRWRFRSVHNIISELVQAKEKYGINHFETIDDNFTMDVDRAKRFCQALIDKKLNLTWSCSGGMRADRMDEELTRIMYQSGCQGVSIGIESGVPEVFDRIKKGERLEDVAKAAELLMKSGIKVTGFFIVGLPGDNLASTKQTIKFIRKLKLNGGAKWNFLVPYPNTELWEWVKTNGVFLEDFEYGCHYSKTGSKIVPTFETPDFSAKDRLRAWKIANLSTESYANVFKIPKNLVLFRLKMICYLMWYAPGALGWKIMNKVFGRIALTSVLKKILFSCFLAVVFFTAVGFWYFPVIFKGNSTETMTTGVVLARNYALTGKYAMENKLNVVVAPELVNVSAMPSTLGNKFSAISFSLIFKIFGWQNWNNLVLISTVICAISLIFFTLAVYLLFGLPVALIFPFVYILIPSISSMAQYVGFMEFALLYFSLFALFYSWSRKTKYKYAGWVLAGLFLGLACLTRESFFVFLPTLFFWLLIKKRIKELIVVFIPIGLLLMFFWLPSMIGLGSTSSDYVKLFVTTDQHADNFSDFGYYGHVYSDPYTYHFDRQRIIDRFNTDLANRNSNWLYKIDRLKVGQNIGVKSIGLFERFVVGTYNLSAHLSNFFAIEFIGGPLILIFLLYGLWLLKKKDKEIRSLFLFWLIGNYLIISYFVLAIRSHLMDYGWIIAALAAIGLANLPVLLKDYFQFKKYNKAVALLIIILTLYSLVLANHVYFGRGYDRNINLCEEVLAQKIKEQNINNTDVIAVGERNSHYILNYLTGKATVYFEPATIWRLVGQDKLQDAFNKFGIKYVAGFDSSTTDMIINHSNAINIAIWPDPNKITPPISYTKMWLLNIIK